MFVQLSLPEPATAQLEAMLARPACTRHPGTTTSGGECPVCLVDELDHLAVRYAEVDADAGDTTGIEERMWELEALLAAR